MDGGCNTHKYNASTVYLCSVCRSFYLLYLGVKIIISSLQKNVHKEPYGKDEIKGIIRQALVLDITNPKAILHVFFSQFITVNYQHTEVSFLILAITLLIISFCFFAVVIFFGVFIVKHLSRKKLLVKYGNLFIGTMFLFYAAINMYVLSWILMLSRFIAYRSSLLFRNASIDRILKPQKA